MDRTKSDALLYLREKVERGEMLSVSEQRQMTRLTDEKLSETPEYRSEIFMRWTRLGLSQDGASDPDTANLNHIQRLGMLSNSADYRAEEARAMGVGTLSAGTLAPNFPPVQSSTAGYLVRPLIGEFYAKLAEYDNLGSLSTYIYTPTGMALNVPYRSIASAASALAENTQATDVGSTVVSFGLTELAEAKAFPALATASFQLLQDTLPQDVEFGGPNPPGIYGTNTAQGPWGAPGLNGSQNITKALTDLPVNQPPETIYMGNTQTPWSPMGPFREAPATSSDLDQIILGALAESCARGMAADYVSALFAPATAWATAAGASTNVLNACATALADLSPVFHPGAVYAVSPKGLKAILSAPGATGQLGYLPNAGFSLNGRPIVTTSALTAQDSTNTWGTIVLLNPSAAMFRRVVTPNEQNSLQIPQLHSDLMSVAYRAVVRASHAQRDSGAAVVLTT